jgi:kynurenine 3-monooxygenase
MESKKKITIVGAGLVGSLLSIFLSRRGYKVDLYERRSDMRKAAAYAGRSINLALSDRGWKALEKIGIADEIRKIAIPMYGRCIHNIDGSTQYQAYGKEQQAIYSVSRGGINCKLLEFQVIYKIYLLEIKFIEIELSLKIHRLHDSFRNLYQYFQNIFFYIYQY